MCKRERERERERWANKQLMAYKLGAREREREDGGANKLSNGIEVCAVVRVREREKERGGVGKHTLAWHRVLRGRVSEMEWLGVDSPRVCDVYWLTLHGEPPLPLLYRHETGSLLLRVLAGHALPEVRMS